MTYNHGVCSLCRNCGCCVEKENIIKNMEENLVKEDGTPFTDRISVGECWVNIDPEIKSILLGLEERLFRIEGIINRIDDHLLRIEQNKSYL